MKRSLLLVAPNSKQLGEAKSKMKDPFPSILKVKMKNTILH